MNNPIRAAIQRHVEGPRLLEMGGPLDGGAALEIGCGRGVGVEIILDLFGAERVHAFDLDPWMVARARRRLARRGDRASLWVGDATAIPAANQAYDAVFDFGIIHHVPDWRAALTEVHRVLKPGGRFYAEEALAGLISRAAARRLLDHPREDRFDHEGFVRGLQGVGFRVMAEREMWGGWFGWYVGERARQTPTAPGRPRSGRPRTA